MKNWLKRALRTFLQAAVGFASANIVMYFTGVSEGEFSSAFLGLVTSCIAAGLAAVMNMKEDEQND